MFYISFLRIHSLFFDFSKGQLYNLYNPLADFSFPGIYEDSFL